MKDWINSRNALGAFFLVCFFRAAGSAMNEAGMGLSAYMMAIGPAIFSVSFLILAAICFSRTLSDLLCRPFTRFIDTVYFGHDDRDPPPLNLKLAGAYRAERRYEEAIAEYERQLEYHPRSAQLWLELVRTAQEAGEQEKAQQFLRTALRRVRRADRLELERAV